MHSLLYAIIPDHSEDPYPILQDLLLPYYEYDCPCWYVDPDPETEGALCVYCYPSDDPETALRMLSLDPKDNTKLVLEPDPRRYGKGYRYPRWDRWTIGGRYLDVFNNVFNPQKNPDSFKSCEQCEGSRQIITAQQCKTCNGSGKTNEYLLPHFCGMAAAQQLLTMNEDVWFLPQAVLTPAKVWLQCPVESWPEFTATERAEWYKEVRTILRCFETYEVCAIDLHI